MNQSWSPDRVITENEAKNLIEEQFPILKPVTIKKFGEGFDNSAFVVNETFIFRFPRRELAAELINTENRLLPVLATKLPISVPNPDFIGVPGGDYPWSFSGYRSLNGNTPTQLTHDQRLLSAEGLAEFLKILHQFPLTDATKLQIPKDLLGRIDMEKRMPMMETRLTEVSKKGIVHQQTLNSIRDYARTISGSLTDKKVALVHGDLHIRNMLVDEKGKVSAIIDWGDTHIGHPAIDLSIVYSFLPLEGRVRFFEIYGDVADETKAIARFKAIYTTILLLLYAFDSKDSQLLEDCQDSLVLALQ